MTKKIIFATVLAILFCAGVFFVYQNRSESPKEEANIIDNPKITITEPIPSYTAEDVAMHSEVNSCWTIISGDVYDITTYIPKHPGGDDVLLACGIDGTTLFTGRVTQDGKPIGSGEPHSDSAKEALFAYKIGTIKE